MSRRLRVHVDHSRCVGNAMCLATAPSTFAHNADRQSVVVDPAGDPEEAVLEAALSCPTGAIRVEVEETGEPLFPPGEMRAEAGGAVGKGAVPDADDRTAAATPAWRFGSRELDAAAVKAVLERNWWGTLATSVDGQPYGVPVVYGYDGEHFYVASAAGRKVEAVEANPVVSLTVVEVEPDASGWSSVIVFGRVEFVRDPAGWLRALKALRRQRGHAGSPDPGDAARMARARVMRITPTEITGRTKA